MRRGARLSLELLHQKLPLAHPHRERHHHRLGERVVGATTEDAAADVAAVEVVVASGTRIRWIAKDAREATTEMAKVPTVSCSTPTPQRDPAHVNTAGAVHHHQRLEAQNRQ